VIYIDTSGMETLAELTHLCKIRNITLIICGLDHQPYEMAQRSAYLESIKPDCLYPDLSSGIAAAIAN
jgi:SulP family sulfate permease